MTKPTVSKHWRKTSWSSKIRLESHQNHSRVLWKHFRKLYTAKAEAHRDWGLLLEWVDRARCIFRSHADVCERVLQSICSAVVTTWNRSAAGSACDQTGQLVSNYWPVVWKGSWGEEGQRRIARLARVRMGGAGELPVWSSGTYSRENYF